MTDAKNFKNLDDLRERVVDLPESERMKQNTANEIQKTLLGLVNEKNEKANAYEKTFKRRVEGKVAKRDRRQGDKEMMEKYGTTKVDMEKATKHKEKYAEQDYKKILEKLKDQHKTADEMKNDIFTIIKRAFNQNITLHKGSDIDKDASLFLLKLTGFFKNDKGEKLELRKIIQEVPQGESGEKGLSIDTGGTISGIKVNNVVRKTTQNKKAHKSLIGSQVIVSEHSDLSPEAKKTERPTSSAHMIYYMLNQLGQISENHKKQLQRFINFVDIVDSLDYQASGIDYPNSYRTLFGLYRNLKIEEIYKYFENPTHTGFEILSDDFLTKHTTKKYNKETKTTEDISLKRVSENQEERVKKNMDQIAETQKKGQFAKFENEMFHIALGDEINDGAQVASYYTCGLLKIFPSGDFYMYSPQLLPKKILDFDTDGHFLIIRNISKENLEKLLEIFEFNPRFTEGLKDRIIAYRESLIKGSKSHTIGKTEDLKEIPIKQLKIGETYPGIVNNVNGKNIYVYLTPSIVGMIKNETKEKELKGGEEIQVKIINISQGENNKMYVSLEKVA